MALTVLFVIRNKKILFVSFLVLVVISWPLVVASAGGATLYLVPLSESRQVGETFDIRVLLDSPNQSVNAIEGVLNFSHNNLEVVNISKAGSILTLWVDGPIFENETGQIRFSGGLPAPGFIGSAGTLLHIIFKAKGSGVGSIIWKKGAVLANDGSGTNIVASLEGSDFAIEKPFFAPGLGPPPLVVPLYFYFIIALSFILLAIIIYWFFQNNLKKKLGRELSHLKGALRHDFDLFRSELMQELEELENIQDLRELTHEEKVKRNKLVSDLNLMMKNLESEIDRSEKAVE